MELIARVIDELSLELASATAAQLEAAEAATHEEARPENDKDTRAVETSYLARGQARRVAELEHELGLLRALRPTHLNASQAIAAGALIGVETEDAEQAVYLLLPGGGGKTFECGEQEVRTVTGRSPIGRALIGARPGDVVEVNAPEGLRELEILAVS